MHWKEKAIEELRNSLYPIPTENNALDWKSGLSDKTERLAQHICAFANTPGGGVLVYGVHNDGTCFSLEQGTVEKTVQTLGNIAINNLAEKITIEHAVLDFDGHSLLFVYIPEQQNKPVYLRGKDIFNAYHRSAGQTVKMSRSQVRILIATSVGVSFEQRVAKSGLSRDDVMSLLNYKSLYSLLDKDIPQSQDAIIELLSNYNLCTCTKGEWSITNLGAVLFANELQDFPTLTDRQVIVRKYSGTNNRLQEFEQHGRYGYAVGFEKLVNFIMKHTSKESIDTSIRAATPTYPRVAIREFIANALVHQDFDITGMSITIEIFSNRLTITNAGAPLNDINRLIDLPPQSRNKGLAQMMFTLRICERRGSGVDRAIAAVEDMCLPPVKFDKGESYTRVSLYPQKHFNDMTKQEKIWACYQHTCLRYEDNEKTKNESLRERFQLSRNKTSVISRIIADTVEAGLIKPADIETDSKKYMSYIPFYG